MDASEALRLDPENQKALFRRALAADKLKLCGRAAKDLVKLLELDSSNAEASQMLQRLKGSVSAKHSLSAF